MNLKFINSVINEYLNENLNINKMHGWYPRFKDRYYKTMQLAHDDIKHAVNHNNKQFGSIFGNDKPEDIIDLFNFIETNKGVKIEPKIKKPKEKERNLEYETNDELVNKQKQLWINRGVEIDRFLSLLKYINTNNPNIYGTENVYKNNVDALIKKIKNGDELPPILLDYDYGILDGHHRWEAAKKLKIKKIPVIFYKNPNEE